MEDKLKKEIADIIEDIFNSKQEDEMRKRTETALKESANTIESLTDELETAKSELTTTVTDLEAAKAQIEELTSQKETLEAEHDKALETKEVELSTLKTELEEKATELDNIKKDAQAKERMAELASAGVVREDTKSQTSKVREMTAEEFAAYKEELESIKASILAELKATEENDEKTKEEGSEEAAAGDEESVNTPPANINPAQSVSAAMNLEIYPSDDVMSQYADLGKAMAEVMKNDK
jgi:chromosome segregation ATPase